MNAGGESGRNARPAHPDWFRAVREQCADAGVSFFFKQWGEWTGEAVSDAQHCVVLPDGTSLQGERMFDRPDERNGEIMARVGKKRAGAALDGHEHRSFPQSDSAEGAQ